MLKSRPGITSAVAAKNQCQRGLYYLSASILFIRGVIFFFFGPQEQYHRLRATAYRKRIRRIIITPMRSKAFAPPLG
jgi:hypothetical protein